jgi:hypothetical protein
MWLSNKQIEFDPSENLVNKVFFFFLIRCYECLIIFMTDKIVYREKYNNIANLYVLWFVSEVFYSH